MKIRYKALHMAVLAVTPIAALATDLSSKCTTATFSGLGPSGTTITSVTLHAAGSQISTGSSSGGAPPAGGTPPAGGGGAPPGGSGGGATTFPYAVCEVQAVIPSANNFALSFPADSANWNGRYVGLGGAGTAGSVNESGTFSDAITGYAASSSDQGHGSTDYTWEEQTQLLIDFAYRANHLTAEASKEFLNAFYGADPTYSYFNGCSGGGGAAMAEATRYPKDFNGILAGASASNPTRMWPYEMSLSAWTYNDKTSTWPDDYVNKLALVSQAAISACDAGDGITDGLIDDPRLCHFDPAVLACSTVTSTSHSDTSCLTPEQVQVFRKIYAGLRDPRTGAQLFPGFVPGSENGWAGHIQLQTAADAQYFPYAVLKNPSEFVWQDFLLTDPFYYWAFYYGDNTLAPILDQMNPDIAPLAAAGTKVIMYHGWDDPNVSPGNDVDFYEAMLHRADRPETVRDSIRLFMVPGMGHCGGNAGYNNFDAFTPLMSWVEQGQAPGQIIGTNSAGNTRPLCAYPEVARPDSTQLNAQGGPTSSADYSCVPPAKARLQPKPPGGSQLVTVAITLPPGYDVEAWNIQNVAIGSIAAVDGQIVGDTYVASFRAADLASTTNSSATPPTVTLTMTHGGKIAYTQATAEPLAVR